MVFYQCTSCERGGSVSTGTAFFTLPYTEPSTENRPEDAARKMITDHDNFVVQLLKAKDGQVAKMILIDTDPGVDQVALDEASYKIKQGAEGTALSGPNSSFFVLRPGRTSDAFVVTCDMNIEERRPSRSVSRACDEVSARASTRAPR